MMQQAADNVLRLVRQSPVLSVTDRLWRFESFRAQFASKALPGGVVLTDRDVRVLLKFLQRDQGALVYDKDVCAVSFLSFRLFLTRTVFLPFD
jgi:charged multivesicular body protein 7